MYIWWGTEQWRNVGYILITCENSKHIGNKREIEHDNTKTKALAMWTHTTNLKWHQVLQKGSMGRSYMLFDVVLNSDDACEMWGDCEYWTVRSVRYIYIYIVIGWDSICGNIWFSYCICWCWNWIDSLMSHYLSFKWKICDV